MNTLTQTSLEMHISPHFQGPKNCTPMLNRRLHQR